MREWLKDLRENKNFAQDVMAEKAGISPSFYCMIENGDRRPSPEVAQRIGEVLEFDWTKFY